MGKAARANAKRRQAAEQGHRKGCGCIQCEPVGAPMVGLDEFVAGTAPESGVDPKTGELVHRVGHMTVRVDPKRGA